MKKKRILIASIIFILIICIVAAVFIVKNRNRSTSNTMYTYSNLNPEYNYSEDNVFYFDDSGILHLIDTASGKDMVYLISLTAHMKDIRAQIRILHVRQLFMVRQKLER